MKHRKKLRELAKFATGLIAGDFLAAIWFLNSGILPTHFFGILITRETTLAGIVFDILLISFLAHYGWHSRNRRRGNSERHFLQIAGLVFGVVSILHLLRILFGVELILGSWEAPYWLNGIGAVVTGFLSYSSFHFARK